MIICVNTKNIMVAPLSYNYPDNSGTCLLLSYSYDQDKMTRLIFHDIYEALVYISEKMGDDLKNDYLVSYMVEFVINSQKYQFDFLSAFFRGYENDSKGLWTKIHERVENQLKLSAYTRLNG